MFVSRIFAYVFNSVPFECISWFVIYAQGFSKAAATSDASAVSDIAHKKLVISARRKYIAFLTDICISFEGQNLHVFIPYEMKSASLLDVLGCQRCWFYFLSPRYPHSDFYIHISPFFSFLSDSWVVRPVPNWNFNTSYIVDFEIKHNQLTLHY